MVETASDDGDPQVKIPFPCSCTQRRGAMTPGEAAEILHLPEGGAADAAQVAARYDKLYAMNDPSKGGSFYLQSKILRAREALDAEIAAGGAKT